MMSLDIPLSVLTMYSTQVCSQMMSLDIPLSVLTMYSTQVCSQMMSLDIPLSTSQCTVHRSVVK